MVQQVTNGIKISVTSNFEGTNYQNFRLFFAFSYEVTIENQSNDTVQLLERQWTIFDSLNHNEVVDYWQKTNIETHTKIHLQVELLFNIAYRSDERFLQYGKLFQFKHFQGLHSHISVDGFQYS